MRKTMFLGLAAALEDESRPRLAWPGAGATLPLRQQRPPFRGWSLSARLSESPASAGAIQTELVFMFANPTQLTTPVSDRGLFLVDVDRALFSKASAGSESLQAELILVLACEAQPSTVLRMARARKHREKQTRCCKEKGC